MQRGFTKRIPALSGLSYSDRLKELNLISLERRRLEFDLVFCFKIVHGLVGGIFSDYGLELSKRKSRGHSLKLTYSNFRVNVRSQFFASRVCEPWNSLTEDTIMSPSVNNFKSKLRLANLNKFLVEPFY